MKGLALNESVLITFIIILLLVDTSQGVPRSQVVNVTCSQQAANNMNIYMPNYVQSMDEVRRGLETSKSKTASTGTGLDRNYAFAECYGDLSIQDCMSCYAAARTVLPSCFPDNGGQIFLDGCFMRTQNYSFYQEYEGANDKVICGNKIGSGVFRDSIRQAISDAVRDAPRSRDYFARKVEESEPAEDSAYVLADCWNTLNESSCTECLESAFASILKCFPSSDGRALHTGCFLRYSNTNFLNPEPTQSDKNNQGTNDFTPSNAQNKRLSKVQILAIVLSVSSIVALLVAFYAWKRKTRSKRKGSDDIELLSMLNSSCLNFKYSTIEKATNFFDEANKLGQGGFGAVYKGVLPDGKEIAVKRLFFNHKHRAGDFFNEVNIISSVDHKNLVKLIGFSCLGPESMLIYEYLPSRSLNHFIFDSFKGKELNWGKRYNIIVGIAEGLAYLHENSKTRIIHRDIKAANILLDSGLNAKIADFGLARSYQQDENHISTAVAGTLGYMAPEYIAYGKLSEKVDVYSYGVLLLEIVTGMPNRGMQTSDDPFNLILIAWEHFKRGSMEEIFDENLMLRNESSSNIKMEIGRVVHIGLLCVQEVASLRPTMSMALQMLSNNIKPLPSPTNPPYISETTMQHLNDSAPIHRVNINPASFPTISYSSFILLKADIYFT
ncbi:hypothetical protein QVD17_03999 [Tagetes erecta]|uniref:Cysteine-rich receptor-like protein kinase 2 n=1 Tax=Tagetes erecta TaxID=13708 RepID=A0AAD8L9C3_TARER|nr:hypothetical protein QVD17_03999 [Tagetes erecta]